MKLRIAAEACLEGGFEEGGHVAGLVPRVILLEEAQHALSIAKVDDGEACLLLEKPTETRRAEACPAAQIIEAVG